MSVPARYSRVLLKISGEALMGDQEYGLDPAMLGHVAAEIESVHRLGVQICLVIGGGNIFCGVKGAPAGMARPTADYMGILATVINSLAMQSALERCGLVTRLPSAVTPQAAFQASIKHPA